MYFKYIFVCLFFTREVWLKIKTLSVSDVLQKNHPLFYNLLKRDNIKFLSKHFDD